MMLPAYVEEPRMDILSLTFAGISAQGLAMIGIRRLAALPGGQARQ